MAWSSYLRFWVFAFLRTYTHIETYSTIIFENFFCYLFPFGPLVKKTEGRKGRIKFWKILFIIFEAVTSFISSLVMKLNITYKQTVLRVMIICSKFVCSKNLLDTIFHLLDTIRANVTFCQLLESSWARINWIRAVDQFHVEQLICCQKCRANDCRAIEFRAVHSHSVLSVHPPIYRISSHVTMPG